MSDGEYYSNKWFVEMLRDVSTERGLELESLSLNDRFEDSLIYSSDLFKFKVEYSPYYDGDVLPYEGEYPHVPNWLQLWKPCPWTDLSQKCRIFPKLILPY